MCELAPHPNPTINDRQDEFLKVLREEQWTGIIECSQMPDEAHRGRSFDASAGRGTWRVLITEGACTINRVDRSGDPIRVTTSGRTAGTELAKALIREIEHS